MIPMVLLILIYSLAAVLVVLSWERPFPVVQRTWDWTYSLMAWAHGIITPPKPGLPRPPAP